MDGGERWTANTSCVHYNASANDKEETMKQSEVTIGAVYQVKVSGVVKPVRIDSQDDPYIHDGSFHHYNRRRRFNGTVLTTGRKIRLTAARMRKELITK